MGCTKCSNLLHIDTRSCLDECPIGYTLQWSTEADIMGRICRRSGYSNSLIAIIVGSIIGLFVCVLIIIIGIYVLKRKTKQKSMEETFIDDKIERNDFLIKLDRFRMNADYFLSIMNDTRRQIRKLHLSGDINGAMSYHNVVRDLAKLLILLNKSNEIIPGPPNDWNRLSTWADYLLEHHKPQITQLIDFLQTPINNSSSQNSSTILPMDPRFDSSTYQNSTFKSNITRTTQASDDSSLLQEQQQQLFGSLISLHEFEQPKSLLRNSNSGGNGVSGGGVSGMMNGSTTMNSNNNPFGSVNNLKYYYQSPPEIINGSSLWLEDEFFKLGFRPQDEITTEL